jgi:hypothetical protein
MKRYCYAALSLCQPNVRTFLANPGETELLKSRDNSGTRSLTREFHRPARTGSETK